MKSLPIFIATAAFVPSPVRGQTQERIIDMHLHWTVPAVRAAICVPWVSQFPPWDPGTSSWEDTWGEAMTNPPCSDPIWSPTTEDGVLEQTLEAMERHNMIGVLNGPPDGVRRWREKAPDRFILGINLRLDRDDLSPDSLRHLFETGDFAVLGEVENQYGGIAPNDERMEPYWALAEELDIPVAIHVGDGTVGTAHIGFLGAPEYRAGLSNPYALEDVLLRHPKLRICVMHYAAPLVDEMIGVLAAHPQVYVDIGGMQWYYPRAFFYEHLRKLVEAGFGKRVMFGSDQGDWPGVIEPAIAIVEEAPFLTSEQKRDIFYNNAARFLRLDERNPARRREM